MLYVKKNTFGETSITFGMYKKHLLCGEYIYDMVEMFITRISLPYIIWTNFNIWRKCYAAYDVFITGQNI